MDVPQDANHIDMAGHKFLLKELCPGAGARVGEQTEPVARMAAVGEPCRIGVVLVSPHPCHGPPHQTTALHPYLLP